MLLVAVAVALPYPQDAAVPAVAAPVDGVVNDDIVRKGACRERHNGSGLCVTGGIDRQRQPRLERLHRERGIIPPAGGFLQSGGLLRVSASGMGGRKQLGDERGHQIGRP